MIVIYNFPRGARGVRVAWVCEEMGLAYRTEKLSYPTSADYRARNPMGTAPFLEDDGVEGGGGVAIGESVAMMLYLAERYGPTPLLPKTDPAVLAKVLQLTTFGEATLAAAMNPLIMTRFMAPDDQKQNWSTGAIEGRLGEALATLAPSPFLAGDGFTLADISIATALDMWTGALRQEVPAALQPWRERMQARPGYQKAQKSQPS